MMGQRVARITASPHDGGAFKPEEHMGTYLRGIISAGLIALGSAGGAVIAMNLHSSSPRLMAAGIASAIIGILGGGIANGLSNLAETDTSRGRHRCSLLGQL
jgi:hypothetical protein